MNEKYLKWDEVPYAGESSPPTNPVEPRAGSWKLTFLRRDWRGNFYSPTGRRLRLPIKNPNEINWDEELKVEQDTLKNTTKETRDIAVYYGTGVPTKQWTPVIDRLIDTYGVSPTRAARILAAVHNAINDTMIVVWFLKFKWNVARPNQYDQKMKTIVCTPRFPAYPSGHATMSGCAEVVLSYFFPGEANKLRELGDINALSRLYGGFHFPADNDEGLELGRYIGNVIVDYLKNQRDSDLEPIDRPYQEYRNTKVDPIDYQQFIPFDFLDNCPSLVMDEFKNNTSTVQNVSKPKLFF